LTDGSSLVQDGAMANGLLGYFVQNGAGWRAMPAIGEWPERLVGWLHGFFPDMNEGLFRWLSCVAIVVLAVVVRRGVTSLTFGLVRRIAGNAKTGIDEKLFISLTSPLGALLMVWAVYTALSVVGLPAALAAEVGRGARVAFTAVVLWGFWRAGGTALTHLETVARSRSLGIATFMPLVKKTLATLFGVVAVLVIADSLGAHVETFLAGLGIGGLALALAAQDTIANMFGSFVVVLDQPFTVGDTVRIAGNEGTVEDIGLRSTRLRTAERTLIIIPNKTVASEAITNLSRMPQRRVEQTIGLTYDTAPEKMEAILEDLRALIASDPGVHESPVTVNFAKFSESSLDIQIVYYTESPVWQKHMDVRERINLKIMHAVAARGLTFALPTQTVIHQGP
jgi:MscS family membrane protein